MPPKDMDFIIIAIVILLGLGAWFLIVQKDKLNLLDGKSLRDFLTSKPELPKKVEEPIATTIVSPTEFRPATTIPVQLPPVFTKPEQPAIVNTTPPPSVYTPIYETPALKDFYPSLEALSQAVQGFPYAVNVNGKQFHVGYGPADEFVTLMDGSVIRGKAPAVEVPKNNEQELTVEEEK